jgi:hypothetical protein
MKMIDSAQADESELDGAVRPSRGRWKGAQDGRYELYHTVVTLINNCFASLIF